MAKNIKGIDPYAELTKFASTKTEAEAWIHSKAPMLKTNDALNKIELAQSRLKKELGIPSDVRVSPSGDSYAVYVEAKAPTNNSPAALMMLATEMINPLIARAEAAIHALGFHVTDRVLLDEDDASDWTQWLRFGKEGKTWQLTVESGPESDEHAWTSVPLHTTSRETRLKALGLLPQLVDELSGRAEREARAAMKVVTDAENFVASLERTHQ